jgi:hypothetical protein
VPIAKIGHSNDSVVILRMHDPSRESS